MFKIELNGEEASIAALTDLVIMDNVECLSITDSQLDDTDISALAGMDGSLKNLDLSGNEIRDISVLVTHTDLVSLNLSNNSIDDIGALVLLTKLKDLDLRGNPIDTKQLDKIRRKLPNTTILID